MAFLDLLVLTSLSDSESVNIKYFQVINKGRRQKKKCIFNDQLTIKGGGHSGPSGAYRKIYPKNHSGFL